MRPGIPQEAVSVGVQLMHRPDTRLRSLEDLRRTTAPAHTLYDIVRKLREGAQVELETLGELTQIAWRNERVVARAQAAAPS